MGLPSGSAGSRAARSLPSRKSWAGESERRPLGDQGASIPSIGVIGPDDDFDASAPSFQDGGRGALLQPRIVAIPRENPSQLALDIGLVPASRPKSESVFDEAWFRIGTPPPEGDRASSDLSAGALKRGHGLLAWP